MKSYRERLNAVADAAEKSKVNGFKVFRHEETLHVTADGFDVGSADKDSIAVCTKNLEAAEKHLGLT